MVLALHWFFTRFILVMVNFAYGSLQSTFIPDTINSGCRPSVDILCILAGGGYVDAFLLHVASPFDYITFARAYTTALPFFSDQCVSIPSVPHFFSHSACVLSRSSHRHSLSGFIRAHVVRVVRKDENAPGSQRYKEIYISK
ncbi:hypothetical protein EV401DRAFT_752471 [Pisolithus croceorrhizus]|nr:hypothetical protein EV401DRAFT_752471 [Pisolithus croceorrhizus]